MEEIVVTPLLRTAIILLAAKRAALQGHEHEVSTLVLGSSHGDFGFDPAHCPGSFNLSCRSQDLKHSARLYEKLAERCPGLRHVVIFHSVFSPGFLLEKTGEKDIAVALNEMFLLGLTYQDALLVQLSNTVAGRLGNMSVNSGYCGFTPELGKGFFPPDYGAQRRADEHLKHNRRGGLTLYLIKMLLEATARGHKALVVLPPVRSDYKAALGMDSRALFAELFEVVETFKIGGDVEVINCFDDPAFRDEHFGDFDHLLPGGEGTRILSAMVNDRLPRP